MHKEFLPRPSVTSPTWCITPPGELAASLEGGTGGNPSVWTAVEPTHPGSVPLKLNPILRWRIAWEVNSDTIFKGTVTTYNALKIMYGLNPAMIQQHFYEAGR